MKGSLNKILNKQQILGLILGLQMDPGFQRISHALSGERRSRKDAKVKKDLLHIRKFAAE